MNVRDIEEVRKELNANLIRAEKKHLEAYRRGSLCQLEMEEDQVMKHVTALAYLDRFGVLHDDGGDRILLHPRQFDNSHKLRIQELLRSPQYKMLKKLDGIDEEVSSSEPERSPPAESALSNG